jgi:phosphonate transport system permease protein
LLTEQLSRFDYRSVIVTIMAYIALTFLVDLVSASVRKGIR